MTDNHWDIHHSQTLYNTPYWGNGYFDINAEGEVIVTPIPGKTSISLYQLAQQFTPQGLSLPVLVRFLDILQHRVDTLYQAFAEAMRQENYQASYTAVYPIKVNQQRHVIQEFLNHGADKVGLEAGSKPELMAVLALIPINGVVICNGYKDREYIRLALIGQQLGIHTYIVIEKMSEVALIIEEAKNLQVTPRLGIRLRLASPGSGKWQNTGGEKGKFGLSTAQLLTVISQLDAAGLKQSVQLMHFHMGSQVANIRDMQKTLKEAARYYSELYQWGVPINVVDVGGGLGIDYTGTRSRSTYSTNYSVQEYANNVVHELWEICNAHDLPHPNIITEAGRAMTAHHAVLITNVIDVEYVPKVKEISPPQSDAPSILQNLWYGLNHITQRSAIEVYHDAVYWLSEAHTMFTHGLLNLSQRAQAEQLYFATCHKVKALLSHSTRLHREILDELNDKLVDKYFCNFSLFQSVPDAWAIDQLFPIMPLHRLTEKPDRRATLQDLTCDSDGQFESYVEKEGVETSLAVHGLQPNKPYLLGIFLVGAYQEILGDIHNLFGDTYAVNVRLNAEGGYDFVDPIEGERVEALLEYVNLDTKMLRNAYRKRLQSANLSAEQRDQYLKEIDAGLIGYTYLEI